MKIHVWYVGGLAIALLIAVGSFTVSESRPTTVAFAQDATAVPTTAAQTTVQSTQPVERENNGFPWGLLGLLGLAGLAGLRPRPEPARHEPVQSTSQGTSKVGVYDAPKK